MTDRFQVPPREPQVMQISIFDIVTLRTRLEEIDVPSEAIVEAIAIFDDHIATFARSLQKGN